MKIVADNTVTVSDSRVFNQLKLMAMSNHFAATIWTGHRLANKGDIVVDDIIDRNDIRFLNV